MNKEKHGNIFDITLRYNGSFLNNYFENINASHMMILHNHESHTSADHFIVKNTSMSRNYLRGVYLVDVYDFQEFNSTYQDCILTDFFYFLDIYTL